MLEKGKQGEKTAWVCWTALLCSSELSGETSSATHHGREGHCDMQLEMAGSPN